MRHRRTVNDARPPRRFPTPRVLPRAIAHAREFVLAVGANDDPDAGVGGLRRFEHATGTARIGPGDDDQATKPGVKGPIMVAAAGQSQTRVTSGSSPGQVQFRVPAALSDRKSSSNLVRAESSAAEYLPLRGVTVR